MIDNSINKVIIGNEQYDYYKDENNKGVLSRNEKLNGKEIKVVLKGDDDKNPKNVEKFVTDMLGELYIQRIIKKFNA